MTFLAGIVELFLPGIRLICGISGLSRGRYVEFVASAGFLRKIVPAWWVWALYRLGLHLSVVGTDASSNAWRFIFAKAVAHAACGDFDKARMYVDRIARERKFVRRRANLAKAMAPYMPEVAAGLLEGCCASDTALLRVAVYSRVRRLSPEQPTPAEVGRWLDVAFGLEKDLHAQNIAVQRPELQMEAFNRFLNSHDLLPVSLRDTTRALGPGNVVCKSDGLRAHSGPLTTVIMTTFQSQCTVRYAIESILAQTYRNIELIIVDDASNDETVHIAQEFAERDNRVRLIRLGLNVGTFVAKNIGLDYAQGEFVTCHDSDDWAHPEKIERQIQPLLASPRLIATISYWVRMEPDGRYYARAVYPLLRLNVSSLLFRKEAVCLEAGIWDVVRAGADSEFLSRLQLVFGRDAILYCKLPLSIGAHRSESLMNAFDTGYSVSGVSRQRLSYWESWNWWHVDCLRNGATPRLPKNLGCFDRRVFPAPADLCVDREAITRSLQTVVIHGDVGAH